MSVTIPESVEAEGRVKAVFVPALADPTSPTVTEATAGTNVSCFLMPDWDGVTPTQNTGEDRRFCSRQTFTRLGRVQYEVAPLMYTYLPQQVGTPGNEGNEAYEALAEGNTGFLIMAYGVDAEGDLSADDIVDVFPVECGVQGKQARGSDEFAPLTVTQTLVVRGPAQLDVALVA